MNAKDALGWLKKHWMIVVSVVVALAALPTAIVLAGQMSESTNKKFQDQVNADFTSVSLGNAKVNYAVPGIDGGKILEKSAEANQAMIDRYAEVWNQIKTKTGAVSERGVAFNKSDHGLLIDGLFPRPDPLVDQVKRREFLRAYIAFHDRILQEARAGMPPTADSVVRELSDYRQAQVERIRAEQGREPVPEEERKLAQELRDMRIARYTARAAELSVYAAPGVFEGVPRDVSDKPQSLVASWDMQERAWIHRDILRAVGAANGASTTGVGESVVKRLSRVAVSTPAWNTGDNAPPPAAYDAGEDKAPIDLSKSITGRFSGPTSKNRWYDVRTVQVEAVVSSRRLPAFIDALAATNFITVLDLDVSRVEPMNDLREGFVYGDEHVVKASMTLEYILLREWRAEAMPEDVKKALAMVEGVTVEGGADAGGGAAPPPPSNRPGRPGGGAGRPGRPGRQD